MEATATTAPEAPGESSTASRGSATPTPIAPRETAAAASVAPQASPIVTSIVPQPPPAATPVPPASPTATTAPASVPTPSPVSVQIREFPVAPGSHPHDVAPAPDGTVWYTAQRSGALGSLDPATGQWRHIALGPGSSPHGVIVGPYGAAWVTDSGLNAIVRVDPVTEKVQVFKLPPETPSVNLNTAAFDSAGILWFTGQRGYIGHVHLETGAVAVVESPQGSGPYGITSTPDGAVYYASLAGSHIAKIDTATEGRATVFEPPTPNQGARRVWSDSKGRIWVSEWNAGQLGMYDPSSGNWKEWRLPGVQPRAYAVYVDDRDIVWVSEWSTNALVRFDPQREQFMAYPLPSPGANVRQILGRPGEVWAAESGTDSLVVIRTGP
ncbi:MAG: SMP-30/gluconolactonase/LRE family protein [Chloroflexi bacterium]|nr:SMP-30/gluconolactonase/LRE family protein [Chloroflexota bacterium]